MSEDLVITTDAVGELPPDVVKINEITGRALLDERRILMRALEAARLAKLDEISPECERIVVMFRDPAVRLQIEALVAGLPRGLLDTELPDSLKRRCGHKLNRHEPCSSCECVAFVDAEGRDAAAAAAALRAAHPDLFAADGAA